MSVSEHAAAQPGARAPLAALLAAVSGEFGRYLAASVLSLGLDFGLLWLLTMMAQVFAKCYRPDIMRRLLCFSLFWHALDIIWVALFTVVYLMGLL